MSFFIGILLGKLNKLGTHGNCSNLIRSYLSERQQYVSMNGFNLLQLPLNIGVPQGLILGPLLFLIYIKDMCKCSRLLNFVHFADDTIVDLEGHNLAQLCDVINAELVNVDTWLNSNKLSFQYC